jgi:hypothetical protein
LVDTLVEGDFVVNSVGDGSSSRSHDDLTASHAIHNGDLGIDAVAGVIDGGQNQAAASNRRSASASCR